MRMRNYYYSDFIKAFEQAFPSFTEYYSFKKIAHFIITWLKKKRKYQRYSEYYVRRHLEIAISENVIIASTFHRYMRRLEIITFICYSFPDIQSL